MSRIATLALAAVVLTACEDSTGPDSDARVTVVNATNTQFDVLEDGDLSPSDARINFSQGTQCFDVEPDDHDLTLRESSSLLNISTFNPEFDAGGSHTVLILPTATVGAYTFLELENDYNAGGGQGGLRVINAAPGTQSYDVYVSDPGAALTGADASGITYGNASSFFDVTAGTPQQVRITNAGSQTVAFDLGNIVFSPGQNLSLVIGAPAAGSTTRRTFFMVHNCF